MESKEGVKQAFFNVKQDISYLQKQVILLKINLSDMKNELKLITEFMKDIQKELKNTTKTQKTPISTQNSENQTIRHITSTFAMDNLSLEPLKTPKTSFSIGNQGVSTDRQTDRQTDKTVQNIQKKSVKTPKYTENPQNLLKIASGVYSQDQKFPIKKASEILNDVDNLRKEFRYKFQHLTPQEFKVFSAIYQLNSQEKQVDYTLLSIKLKLSKSSIRDYISRLITKGIPIIKQKINNKQVILHISEDLKKIASLQAILKLREL